MRAHYSRSLTQNNEEMRNGNENWVERENKITKRGERVSWHEKSRKNRRNTLSKSARTFLLCCQKSFMKISWFIFFLMYLVILGIYTSIENSIQSFPFHNWIMRTKKLLVLVDSTSVDSFCAYHWRRCRAYFHHAQLSIIIEEWWGEVWIRNILTHIWGQSRHVRKYPVSS